MALEFRNRLEAGLGLALPATLVWNYPTIADLARYLAGTMELTMDDEEVTEPAGPENGHDQLRRLVELEQLSEEQAAKRLVEKLDRLVGKEDG
jgi:myxalamid-type polyketide synthase MxaE and MxaD